MTLLLVLSVLATFGLAACGSSSESGATGGTTQTYYDPAGETAPEPEDSASEMSFDRENYSLLVTDPSQYKGARVEIVGKVFSEVERDEGATYFQMWADPKNSEWNTIVAVPDSSLNLRADDYVRVVGEVSGEFEGENAFGAELTAVTIKADSVAKVDATAAAAPALKTLEKGQQNLAGVIFTVQKVELADDETRVFIAINNKSGYDFSFYSSSVRAVSGSRQFESTYSIDYPEVSSDLATGAFTTGVIVFPAMNPNAPLRLLFEGSSEDSSVGNYGSLEWGFSWK